MLHWLDSLEGFGACAKVQRHQAVLCDGVGVGAVDQQQFGALWLAVFTGLVQRGGAPGGQVYIGPPLQQEPQAVGEASAGRDVKRRGQLLLITQRPKSCRERDVKSTLSSTLESAGNKQVRCARF